MQPIAVILAYSQKLWLQKKKKSTSEIGPRDQWTGIDQKSNYMRTSFHGTILFHEIFQGSKETNSPIQLWHLWATSTTSMEEEWITQVGTNVIRTLEASKMFKWDGRPDPVKKKENMPSIGKLANNSVLV